MYEEYSTSGKIDFAQWKKIFPFVAPYKKQMAVLVVCAVYTAAFDAIFPLMTRYAINNFIYNKTLKGIGLFALLYVALALIQGVGSVMYSKKAIYIEMCIGRDMRYSLYRHVQELSVDYFNKTPVGFILARIMNDTNSMGAMFSWRLAAIIFQGSYLISVLTNMMVLNLKLGLVVLGIMAFLFVMIFFVQRRLIRLNRIARKQNSKLTAAYNEYINGAKTIKSLCAKDVICDEFDGVNRGMWEKTMKVRTTERTFMPIVVALASMTSAIVLSLSVPMVNNMQLDVGTLAVFISYTFSILGPIEDLTNSLNNTVSLQANVERVNKLMETAPTVTDSRSVEEIYGDIYAPKTENWEEVKGDIEFKNVSFKYPETNKYVLENFNLKIKAGSCIAIVGHTGAGKSTLVNLVCRFFEPTSGEILIDGVDYRKRSILWLESNLSYVLQTPHLFSGTIWDNITYANPKATKEQVDNAAKIAQAYDFIQKLPQGYNTEVGQGGDKLSTGQKQLISIARAILAQGKIMVMDEATASVDTKTEQLINSMTSTLIKDKTSFIIAHRLSTVKNADLIILMEEGKISEMGTHKQLLAKKGKYYDMYTGQWEEQEQDNLFNSLGNNSQKIQ